MSKPLRHSDALWRRRPACVNIAPCNGLVPDGTKPSHEPMFISHQWGPVTIISGVFVLDVTPEVYDFTTYFNTEMFIIGIWTTFLFQIYQYPNKYDLAKHTHMIFIYNIHVDLFNKNEIQQTGLYNCCFILREYFWQNDAENVRNMFKWYTLFNMA